MFNLCSLVFSLKNFHMLSSLSPPFTRFFLAEHKSSLSLSSKYFANILTTALVVIPNQNYNSSYFKTFLQNSSTVCFWLQHFKQPVGYHKMIEEYILSQYRLWEMDSLFREMSGIATITIGFTNNTFMDHVWHQDC